MKHRQPTPIENYHQRKGKMQQKTELEFMRQVDGLRRFETMRMIIPDAWNDLDGTWFEYQGTIYGPFQSEREAEETYRLLTTKGD